MPAVHRFTPELFQTNNIIHGYGEVAAIPHGTGHAWILPGREITQNRELAQRVAERLDRMIQANIKRYNRSLVW